jgi:antibiotic biosynthesis monooxygenase (ABM) superfamily enzyme
MLIVFATLSDSLSIETVILINTLVYVSLTLWLIDVPLNFFNTYSRILKTDDHKK